MFVTYIVKAVFIYFTKNCDDVTGTKGQFSLLEKNGPWDTFGLLYFGSSLQQCEFTEDFPLHQIYWGLMSLKCCASFSKSMWCILNMSFNSVSADGLLQL